VVVVDFVGEGGATREGIRMLDIISSEINIVGNLVGSHNDLCELMVLAARGAVRLHTVKYSLDDFQSAINDLDAGLVRGRAILVP
jgi:NAD+-dependent secondary alcohol dehydrogenase Adh1